MSLFKLKNLWTQSFSQQQFDEKHLCLGKIDDKPALAIGSFSGTLRIFTVEQNPSFKVSMIYQNTFQSPIISVQFVTHPQQRTRNTLGILLYKKFLYLSLKHNPTTKTHQPKLLPLQTEPSFAIDPKSLSLLTLNSSIQYLNPLSTQSIKVADPIFPFARHEDCIYYADGEELVMVRNTVEQWRVVVGPMRWLELYGEGNGDGHGVVVVIGDNALWEVKESHIVKTKVLEQDVSCGTIIHKEDDYNILIANFANQILIYTSTYSLIWAIKSNQIPIRIRLFTQTPLTGALAILGEQGTLSISYLGSQLPQTEIEPLNENIDMEQVQLQTQKMLSQIRSKESEGDGRDEASRYRERKEGGDGVRMVVSARVSRSYEMVVDDDSRYFKVDGNVVCCIVQCMIKVQKQPIYQATATIHHPSNLTPHPATHSLPSVKTPQKIQFTLLCSSTEYPHSSRVQITLRYETADKRKGCSVLTESCELPLDFQCWFKSAELEKEPANKVVLKGSGELPGFSGLFYEFGEKLGASKNITVTLSNGVLCSMGYNKNNTKVKIQSNEFLALGYMLTYYNSRYETQLKSKKSQKNELQIDDIPLQQFFNIVKQHYNLRIQTKQKSKQLQKRCQQFRNTQKKIITKMKQKASSINNMDKLLQHTYRKLIHTADQYEQCQTELRTTSHNLKVSLQFVLQLLFIKSKANARCKDIVYGIVGYEGEGAQFGWEEKVVANSAYYLGKKFNYAVDGYNYDQVYKTVMWVIAKVNDGKWNQ